MDYEIHYDFPPELDSWINQEFGLWPAALRELPEAARLGIVQQWLMFKYFIGIEIRYINNVFHAMVYPLPGCLIDNIFNSTIDLPKYQDAWALAVMYSLATVQEWENIQKKRNPKKQYGFKFA